MFLSEPDQGLQSSIEESEPITVGENSYIDIELQSSIEESELFRSSLFLPAGFGLQSSIEESELKFAATAFISYLGYNRP